MAKEQLFDEALTLLREYLKINTVSPPSNVKRAVDFLAGVLSREEINYEIYESAPGKFNLLARIEGDGSLPPTILLNHMDVVPVEREKWTADPFGAQIKDGYLYGRGALDMKGIGIFQLLSLVYLKRNNLTPRKDVFFLATCDEEVGGHKGVGWMLENVPPLQEAESVINEGWPLVENQEGKLDHIKIDNSEKIALQIQLSAEGTTGHASIPLNDNPNKRIVEAVHNILNSPPNFMVIPTVARYFKTIADLETGELTEGYRDLKKALRDPDYARKFVSDPNRKALVTNTASLTILKGGEKINVIPSKSEACLDIRLLPGIDRDSFLKDLKKKINDEKVKVKIVLQSEPAPESPIESATYQAITDVYSRRFPGVPITPCMLTACTDSRFFRARGIDAYGLAPYRLSPEEHKRIHAHDERISLENIKMGTDLMIEIVKEVAGVG